MTQPATIRDLRPLLNDLYSAYMLLSVNTWVKVCELRAMADEVAITPEGKEKIEEIWRLYRGNVREVEE